MKTASVTSQSGVGAVDEYLLHPVRPLGSLTFRIQAALVRTYALLRSTSKHKKRNSGMKILRLVGINKGLHSRLETLERPFRPP